MTRAFIDTNILIYAYAQDEPEKHDLSGAILAKLAASRSGVISTQVMQEFIAVSTRKSMRPLEARAALRAWAAFDTVQITPLLIDTAVDEMELSRISFWDSLIIAAAASAHCTELLTEDLQPGQVIRGITVRNPFV